MLICPLHIKHTHPSVFGIIQATAFLKLGYGDTWTAMAGYGKAEVVQNHPLVNLFNLLNTVHANMFRSKFECNASSELIHCCF